MTQFLYLGGVVPESTDLLFRNRRTSPSLVGMPRTARKKILYDMTTAPLSLDVRTPCY